VDAQEVVKYVAAHPNSSSCDASPRSMDVTPVNSSLPPQPPHQLPSVSNTSSMAYADGVERRSTRDRRGRSHVR
jgi:hypothetical protein